MFYPFLGLLHVCLLLNMLCLELGPVDTKPFTQIHPWPNLLDDFLLLLLLKFQVGLVEFHYRTVQYIPILQVGKGKPNEYTCMWRFPKMAGTPSFHPFKWDFPV